MPERQRELFDGEVLLLCGMAAKRLVGIVGKGKVTIIYRHRFGLKAFLDSLLNEGIDFTVLRLSERCRRADATVEGHLILFWPIVSQKSELRRACVNIKRRYRARKILLAALLFEGMQSSKC